MIRGALDDASGVRGIACNLTDRTVRVVHECEPCAIQARLVPLGLGIS
jgi:hypothetical protein